VQNTKIRWTDHSWNNVTGCTKVSPGCDRCYAEEVTKRFPGVFPNGFEPTFKPHKLNEPFSWPGARVFVNSMSDAHHKDFTYHQIAASYEVMLLANHHHYQILTKRPERMKAFFARWLKEKGLDKVPDHIWIGTSIESDKYAYRADVLREIPAGVRFISAEPLIAPIPSLDLTDIHWLIVGGESGNGFRPMSHAWALELRDKARAAKRADGGDMTFPPVEFMGSLVGTGTAFYFKQSSAFKTERGIELGGRTYEEYPQDRPEPVRASTNMRVHWLADKGTFCVAAKSAGPKPLPMVGG